MYVLLSCNKNENVFQLENNVFLADPNQDGRTQPCPRDTPQFWVRSSFKPIKKLTLTISYFFIC